MKVPVLDYDRFIRALQRDGWVVVRQRSHVRLGRKAGSAWQDVGLAVERLHELL